eukprot:CAMPEP_0117424896 /NCGR_PEP_ID=MMETSP0758-20121206/5250_1 /TAXON_ID=63605 /ORGANISM="Percolomonas cosmopolitus, Strain AE-1 (ATCC 50343)" /LENGTH=231 /DNA_ID=CAMNT_0005209003 /DNA_START=166 /DNA_END=861 /DNA_ORIENTATION=-
MSVFSYRSSPLPSIFITTEDTPNPNAMVFKPQGESLLPSKDMPGQQFSRALDASSSPLARRLFQIDHVSSVFIAFDSFTINISHDSPDEIWEDVKSHVFSAVTEFFLQGDPAIQPMLDSSQSSNLLDDDDDEIIAAIKETIEIFVRPIVHADGGDVRFLRFDDDSGVVYVELVGSCDGCPSAGTTVKYGIENAIKHYVPEVLKVVSIDSETTQKSQEVFDEFEKSLSSSSS